MHIAYIHQFFTTPEQRGISRSYEMARRLVRAGHRVSMITGNSDLIDEPGRIGEVRRFTVDGIEVHRVIEPYANAMGFARRWIAFLRFAGKALRIAKSLKDVDLVFATSTPLTVGDPGRKAAKFHGCPFVFEVRDLWPERAITLGILKSRLIIAYLRRMEHRVYHAADHIITLAPRITEGVIETGYPTSRVTMIPNGCDLDLFLPDENKRDLDSDPGYGNPGDFRLIHAGANGLVNGIELALDAAAVLKARGVRGVRFLFVGDGGQTPRLKKRCADDGLDDMITWKSSIPKRELARIMPKMDVGMMLCRDNPGVRNGASPNKFFDYLACGLPVLINYPGWLSEYLDRYRCGTTTEPGDAESFADAVLELMNRRDELKNLGANSRKLAEEVFSRDKQAELFVETLERFTK